ncbi:hypothetical protein V5032_28105 [Escherichia coli]|uniref:hypothetical protein n=1 Tax=Escherichia coli TaxID=562 RepID=UPI00307659A2
MAVLPGCHQIMVRLLNHFIQQFFWEDTTTSGNTFKLFVDFSGQLRIFMKGDHSITSIEIG